jgi:hypothetical protein
MRVNSIHFPMNAQGANNMSADNLILNNPKVRNYYPNISK